MVSHVEEIAQLVVRERHARDRGLWHRMDEVYLPEATVNLSWFRGSGADFISRSRAMAEGGTRGLHRMSPPVVDVHGDRAHAEASAMIELQLQYEGVAAVMVSSARLNYRLVRQDGSWKILSLDCIYERDSLTPATPGQSLIVPLEAVAHRRPSYALLALLMEKVGYPVGDDQLGDDRRAGVEAYYQAVRDWLAAV